MKSAFILGSAIAFLSLGPALAADTEKMDKMDKMGCTEADMKKMDTKMDGMSADGKKMAMEHMKMAKDSMAKGDMKSCEMHMGEAMGAMEKK